MAQATRRGCQKRGGGVRARKTGLRATSPRTKVDPHQGCVESSIGIPPPSSPRPDLLPEPRSRPRQQRWPPRPRALRQPPRCPGLCAGLDLRAGLDLCAGLDLRFHLGLAARVSASP